MPSAKFLLFFSYIYHICCVLLFKVNVILIFLFLPIEIISGKKELYLLRLSTV